MKKLFNWEHIEIIKNDDGTTRSTGKVIGVDHCSVELTDEKKLVFCFNGKQSKEIPIVRDYGYAFKAQKTRFKTYYEPERLFKELTDELWNCYLYRFCKFYVTGVLE